MGSPQPIKPVQMTATQAMSSFSDFAKQKKQEIQQQQEQPGNSRTGWSSIDVEQNVTPSQNSQSPWMENSKHNIKSDQTGWGNSTQTSNPWFSDSKGEVKNNSDKNGFGSWNPNKNIGW